MTYAFLSPDWIAAAREIRAQFSDSLPPSPVEVRINVVVTDAPFGNGEVRGSIDTSSGRLAIEEAHLEAAELTITLDYGTARAMLIDQDAQALMRSFLEGKIKPEGDVSKLLMLQPLLNVPTDPEQRRMAGEVAERIRSITAS